MCEINAIIRKDKEKGLFTAWMAKMAWSFKRNSDGIGALFIKSDGTYSVVKALDIEDFLGEIENIYKEFINSVVIIGHSRFATSGENDLKNVHPIKKGKSEFIVIHNGVISELSGEIKGKNDSYSLMVKLNKEYKKTNSAIKSIENVLSDLSYSATYSLFIYHKTTKRLFYVKEQGTEINFSKMIGKKIILASTKKGVYPYLTKKIDIKPYVLYEIDLNNIKLKVKGKIKKSKWYNSKYYNYVDNYIDYLSENKTCDNTCNSGLKDYKSEEDFYKEELRDYYDYIKDSYY